MENTHFGEFNRWDEVFPLFIYTKFQKMLIVASLVGVGWFYGNDKKDDLSYYLLRPVDFVSKGSNI